MTDEPKDAAYYREHPTDFIRDFGSRDLIVVNEDGTPASPEAETIARNQIAFEVERATRDAMIGTICSSVQPGPLTMVALVAAMQAIRASQPLGFQPREVLIPIIYQPPELSIEYKIRPAFDILYGANAIESRMLYYGIDGPAAPSQYWRVIRDRRTPRKTKKALTRALFRCKLGRAERRRVARYYRRGGVRIQRSAS